VRAQSLRAVTLPAVLGGARIAPTTVVASLFLLTVSCRTVLIAVIPLQALALLGSAQAVSVMFLLVSTCSIATALLLPALILRIRTRRAFHLAAAIGILGALLLAVPVLPVFALGMVCWAVSTATFEVTMNLYIMHLILRRDIARFEPKRVLFMVTAYTVGPALGVWLQAWAGHFAPFALAILTAPVPAQCPQSAGARAPLLRAAAAAPGLVHRARALVVVEHLHVLHAHLRGRGRPRRGRRRGAGVGRHGDGL
jgi:hypothetical protein